MSKKKARSKENHNQPGEKGLFYYQKKCFFPGCGKLIWGSSAKNHRSASKDCYFRMKAHEQEHQKDKTGKQLNLTILRPEEKQAETVRRITLRGEEK